MFFLHKHSWCPDLGGSGFPPEARIQLSLLVSCVLFRAVASFILHFLTYPHFLFPFLSNPRETSVFVLSPQWFNQYSDTILERQELRLWNWTAYFIHCWKLHITLYSVLCEICTNLHTLAHALPRFRLVWISTSVLLSWLHALWCILVDGVRYQNVLMVMMHGIWIWCLEM